MPPVDAQPPHYHYSHPSATIPPRAAHSYYRGGPPPHSPLHPRSSASRPGTDTAAAEASSPETSPKGEGKGGDGETANTEDKGATRVTTRSRSAAAASEEEREESENEKDEGKRNAQKTSKKDGRKDGDPLSLLAKVSSAMNNNKNKDDGSGEDDGHNSDGRGTPPVPTSPTQRRVRPSPVITPTSTPSGKPPMMPHPQISPVDQGAEGGYWASEPAMPYPQPRSSMQQSYSRRGVMDAPYPSHHYPPHRPPYPYPPQQQPPAHPESPAVVERGSFDSTNEQTSEAGGAAAANGAPSSSSFDSSHATPARRGPPPYYPGNDYGPPRPYWRKEGGPQMMYPPPRWSAYPDMRPSYPPPHEGGPPMTRESPSPSSYHRPPFRPPGSYMAPPPHMAGRPRDPSMHYAPYTYVQQPQLEEKTILRKKFSWKHYPELERFLIANRDEYLKHSSMNYTAEQKQYNNWLTEQLLHVANEHHYVFDPAEFNFVAIRDRIRCYYKSYVQTARKRGLNLPTAASKAAASVTPSHSREEDNASPGTAEASKKKSKTALPYFKSAKEKSKEADKKKTESTSEASEEKKIKQEGNDDKSK